MANHTTQRRPGRPPASSVDVPTPERILQVAARLFMEYGFDSVNMEQIAEACGVTKAVVYYYFASKANVFTESMIQVMETVRKRTLAILGQEGSLSDRLLTITKTRLRIQTQLDMNAIMRGGHSMLSEEQLQTMRDAEERLLRTIADAFAEEIEAGVLGDIDPVLAARTYLALLLVGQTHLQAKPYDEASIDQLAADLIQILYNGMARP